MPHVRNLLRPMILAWLATTAVLLLGAESSDRLDELVADSPFSGTVSVNRGAATDGALELRSVVGSGDKIIFSIFEPATNSSKWVGLKEAGEVFTVQSYDEAGGVAVVAYQGRALPLTLRTAKMAAAAITRGPEPVINGRVAAGPSPTPTQDGSRIAALAEEIARRRALRTQAINAPAPVARNP